MHLSKLLLFIVFAIFINANVAEKCIPETNMLIGAYRRQCNVDGTYVLRQCWGSVGRCWCVDKFTGERLRDVTDVFDDCTL